METSKIAEAAGVWLRVSTGDQTEANQLPDIQRHCDQHGYEVAVTYTVHGKSAYKGAQDPDWQRVVKDVRAGKISVVVIWKVDRLDRQNIMHAVPMVNSVLDIGGRIEFATQPIDLTTTGGRIAFATFCEMAHEESKIKSDRIRIKFNAIEAAKALHGRPPYGYRIVRENGFKYLEPDKPGTADVVVKMVEWYLVGDTLATIANKLDAEGIAPSNKTSKNGWSPRIVAKILRSEANLIGKRRNDTGKVIMTYDPLIDKATWHKLQTLLKANSRAGGSRRKNPAMLIGVAVCGKCGGPMHYREHPGKDKTPYVWKGYRCDGTDKNPSKCRNMVPAEEAHAAVNAWFAPGTEFGDREYFAPVPVDDSTSDAIDDIEVKIRNLDFDAEDFAETQARLLADRKKLQDQLKANKRIGRQPTGITVADHWASLDDTAKRADLIAGEVLVHMQRNPDAGPTWDIWISGNPYALIPVITGEG